MRRATFTLALAISWACAEDHSAPRRAPGPPFAEPFRDAEASEDATASVPDLFQPAEASVPSEAHDCGDAGPPLSRLFQLNRPETLCLRSRALIDSDGRTHVRDAGSAEGALTVCPLPVDLAWPGGGETCWWEPVCNIVETRHVEAVEARGSAREQKPDSASAQDSDAGSSLECCYDVQRMCGV